MSAGKGRSVITGTVPRSGGITFAGVAMLILGSLDVLWGLAAILNDEVVVVGGHGPLIFDLTAWGWVQLILGAVVALAGLGLFAGKETARVLGAIVLGANTILQIVWFTAAPLWAVLIIILDIAVIYQLIVSWTEDEEAW